MSATFWTGCSAILTASMLALSGAGCVIEQTEGDENLGTLESASKVGNTSTFNGRNLNGKNLNGRNLNGKNLNGKNLNGDSLSGITLKGSNITAYVGYKKVDGTKLIGAEIEGELDDQTPVVLRIDDVTKNASPHWGSAIYTYSIAFKTPDMADWGYVCDADGGAVVPAIPLKGKWNYGEGVPGGGSRIDDPDAITFACDGGALYKCVVIGYEPWTKVKGKSLTNHHQACTRMIRADYCGDGTSWTEDGTLINIIDILGIQKDTANWPVEAEWDVDGAVCLSHTRIEELDVAPACSFAKEPTKCGKKIKWYNPTLLVSEAL